MNWEKVIAQLGQCARDCAAQIRQDATDPDFDDEQKLRAKQVILTVQGVFIGLAEALQAGLEKH